MQDARENSSSPPFDALEKLRGLLAGYVVVAHARGHGWIGYQEMRDKHLLAGLSKISLLIAKANLLTRFSNEAVIAFFVLSGFSIAHALRFSPPPGTFFFRRFLRLYPTKAAALGWACLVFVAASLLAPELIDGPRKFHLESDFLAPSRLVSNLLYMPYGHLVAQFWSLPHEMLFYLLAPFLIFNWRIFLGVASCLWVAGLRIPVATMESWFLLSFIFHYLILFAIGAAAYNNYDGLMKQYRKTPGIWVFLLLLLAGLQIYLMSKYDFSAILLRDLVTGLASVIVIILTCHINPKNVLLDRLGRQSYSLYVSHLASIVLTVVVFSRLGFMGLFEERPYVWPVLLPTAFLFAEILYYFVERPTRGYLDRTRVQREPVQRMSK